MLLHLLPAICASVLGAVGCQQDQPTAVQPARPHADVAPARDTTLAPSADTYIRQGSPNQNQGAELILRLQSSGKNRALLRWDQQALAQAVGGGTVTAARLELTIADLGDNWSTAGRTIDLYRLTHDWTELGATWNCAVDSVPGNPHPDCGGATAWDMDHSGSYPWAATPTATALLKNGQTGVVSFDVTSDVVAWLAGQPNDGWILKKTAEGDPGKVDFGSRESLSAPHLVLGVLADTAAPTIPDSAYWPSGNDTLRTVPDRQFPDMVYFRDLFDVKFMDSTSGATINGFMVRNRAVILGGSRWLRDYTIRVPDPGPGQDAFDSLVARLDREPGVRYVAAITRRGGDIKEDARYPSDGPGFARSDWFAGGTTDPVWSRLAVRAPLAWGCENGKYSSAPLGVGVPDFNFDTNHTDLWPNIAGFFSLSHKLALDTAAKLRTPGFGSHGTAVAGVLAAVGDNGLGVTGMMWKVPLRLYALADRDSAPVDRAKYFTAVLGTAAGQGVRVIVSTADFGRGSGGVALGRVSRVQDAIRQYVGGTPGGVFVFAAGDDSLAGTLDAFYSGGTVVQAAVAGLVRDRTDSTTRRVIVVTGTQPGNSYWSGGTFFRGGTDIAAPAWHIRTLVPGNGVGDFTGTSVAAPFVAGVAAMLWTMDPTLPADSIKDYILRGAQQPRLSATTGQRVDAQPVQGAPETVYQLDAYGALSLLSKEHAEVPLCGVSADLAPSPDDGSFDGVMLRRVPGFSDTLRLSLAGLGIFPDGVSLAQGGRLLAVSGGNDQTPYRTVFVDQTGRAVAPALDGIERRFLERDTVDLDWNAHQQHYPQVTLRLGDSAHTVRSLDVVADVVPQSSDVYEAQVVVSPSGECAAVYTGSYVPGSCDAQLTWAVVRLSDLAVTPITSQTNHCGGVDNSYQHTGMAWTPDSRTVTVLAKHFQDLSCGVFLYETIVTSLPVGGSPNSVPVNGLYLGAPSYAGDGALFSAYQWNATLGGCTLGWRPASSLATVAGTLDLPYGALTCFWWPEARSPSQLVVRPRGAPLQAPWPLAPQRADCQPLAPRARP